MHAHLAPVVVQARMMWEYAHISPLRGPDPIRTK